MFKILRIFYLSNKSSNNSKNIFIKKQFNLFILILMDTGKIIKFYFSKNARLLRNYYIRIYLESVQI